MSNELVMYVLYEKPADYPDEYVVRIHRAVDGNPEPVVDKELFAKCDTMEKAVREIPEGLTFFHKSVQDPISIVGMWV